MYKPLTYNTLTTEYSLKRHNNPLFYVLQIVKFWLMTKTNSSPHFSKYTLLLLLHTHCGLTYWWKAKYHDLTVNNVKLQLRGTNEYECRSTDHQSLSTDWHLLTKEKQLAFCWLTHTTLWGPTTICFNHSSNDNISTSVYYRPNTGFQLRSIFAKCYRWLLATTHCQWYEPHLIWKEHIGTSTVEHSSTPVLPPHNFTKHGLQTISTFVVVNHRILKSNNLSLKIHNSLQI